MTGKTDVVKGRIKEAAGDLTGNEKLREEGQADQEVGKVKQAAQQVIAEAKEAAATAVNKAKDAARRTIDKVKDATKKMTD